MADLVPQTVTRGKAALQELVTGLLALALAYRQGQVAFDIPPLRGELLALIAITLWTASGVLRNWRSERDADGRIEWALGGGLVGLLLLPHVPMLALVVGVGSVGFAIVRIVMNAPEGIRFIRILVGGRPAMILAALALTAFFVGDLWDWVGLGFLVLAGGLVAWQSGRHLWLWSKGRASIR